MKPPPRDPSAFRASDLDDLFPYGCLVVTAPASEVSPAEFVEHFIPRESELRHPTLSMTQFLAGCHEEDSDHA